MSVAYIIICTLCLTKIHTRVFVNVGKESTEYCGEFFPCVFWLHTQGDKRGKTKKSMILSRITEEKCTTWYFYCRENVSTFCKFPSQHSLRWRVAGSAQGECSRVALVCFLCGLEALLKAASMMGTPAGSWEKAEPLTRSRKDNKRSPFQDMAVVIFVFRASF